MEPLAVLAAAAAILVAFATHVVWVRDRVERLELRLAQAQAALDAALLRRAAVAGELAAHCRRHDLLPEELAAAMEDAAVAAETCEPDDRERAENDLTRRVRAAVAELVEPGRPRTAQLASALADATGRLALARQFHNDAVRRVHELRRGRVGRVLVDRRGPRPQFFEVDDAALPVSPAVSATSSAPLT